MGDRIMTEEEIEKGIGYVAATMAMEGLTVTEEEKENMRKVGRGELTTEEVNRMYLEKYTSGRAERA